MRMVLVVKGKNEKSLYIRDNILKSDSLVVETKGLSLSTVSDISFNYVQIEKNNWKNELAELLKNKDEINAEFSNLILYLNLEADDIQDVKLITKDISINVIISVQSEGILEVAEII